jgi:hypothetical protein
MVFLLPIVIILQITDGVLTYSSVGNHLAKEGNPLLQNIAGTGNFLLMKVIGALICALLLWLVYKRFPRISIIFTSCIVIFYSLILTWNLNILFP